MEYIDSHISALKEQLQDNNEEQKRLNEQTEWITKKLSILESIRNHYMETHPNALKVYENCNSGDLINHSMFQRPGAPSFLKSLLKARLKKRKESETESETESESESESESDSDSELDSDEKITLK